MTKKTIFIKAPHTVFSNDGQPLSPGFEYVIKDGYAIQQLIDDGFAVETSNEEEKSASKTSPKTQKEQATDSSTLTGEL